MSQRVMKLCRQTQSRRRPYTREVKQTIVTVPRKIDDAWIKSGFTHVHFGEPDGLGRVLLSPQMQEDRRGQDE